MSEVTAIWPRVLRDRHHVYFEADCWPFVREALAASGVPHTEPEPSVVRGWDDPAVVVLLQADVDGFQLPGVRVRVGSPWPGVADF